MVFQRRARLQALASVLGCVSFSSGAAMAQGAGAQSANGEPAIEASWVVGYGFDKGYGVFERSNCKVPKTHGVQVEFPDGMPMIPGSALEDSESTGGTDEKKDLDEARGDPTVLSQKNFTLKSPDGNVQEIKTTAKEETEGPPEKYKYIKMPYGVEYYKIINLLPENEVSLDKSGAFSLGGIPLDQYRIEYQPPSLDPGVGVDEGAIERIEIDTKNVTRNNKGSDEDAVFTVLCSQTYGFTLTPLVATENGDVGLRYSAEYIWERGNINDYAVRLFSDGEFSFSDSSNNSMAQADPKFEKAFTVGAEAKTMVKLPEPFDYLHVEGQPVGIEADQDLDAITYDANATLGFTVPYTQYVAEGIQRLFDAGKLPEPKMLVGGGYTYAGVLRDRKDVIDRDFVNRVHFFADWRIPVVTPLDIYAKWQGFVGLGGNAYKQQIDVGAKIYTSGLEDWLMGGGDSSNKNYALVISYINGALPPKFERAEGVRVGFELAY